MKKTNSSLSLLLSISLALTACGKGMHLTGPGAANLSATATKTATAPTANTTGATNTSDFSKVPITATNGRNGNKIYTGPADPTADLGLPEDLYINATTGDLFLKTGDSVWRLKGNLRGPQGQAGAPGQVSIGIISGKGAPAAGSLKPGAMYLDKTNGDLYSANPDGTIVLVMNLRGPAGNNGTGGGTNGTKVWDGVGVPAATLGGDQDLYIETSSGDLYRKMGPAWKLIFSLGQHFTPVAGDFLLAGEGPPAAETMPVGSSYLDTTNGDLYHRGADGKILKTMSLKGAPGSQILVGKVDPTAGLGNSGDMYFNTVTHDLYQKTDATTWLYLTNLNGAPGKDGKDGKDGTSTVVTKPSISLSLDEVKLGFHHDKFKIAENSVVENDALAKLVKTAQEIMKDKDSIDSVLITGHTDKTGTVPYNIALSLKRANAVAGALETASLDTQLVSVEGKGEPKTSSCGTKENCPQDRRVNVRIFFKNDASVDATAQAKVMNELKAALDDIWKK